ncbi:MAG: hypothetical protein GXP45_06635 [bacterium]|nr:hypothetical protein [bacterium]
MGTYATLKNFSETKLKAIVQVLINIFSQMDTNILSKYHFDKDLLIQELQRILL